MKAVIKKTTYIMLIVLAAAAMILPAAGCAAQEDNARVRIVTTIFAPYDFAREITAGISGVQISMLLTPGAESHTYEPTPRDIVALSKCDLFVYAGGENDAWVDTILEGLDNTNLRTVVMTDCAELVEEEMGEGMEHPHEGEHSHEEHTYDEHVWTSLRNAQAIVNAIATQLQEADPEYAQAYRTNAEAYNAKLALLDTQFSQMINIAARKTVIVADRFPLRYFVDDYVLDYFAALPGCSAESEASAQTVAFLHNKIIELEIPIVFTIELSNQQIARTVIEGTNAQLRTIYTCHNVTAADFASGISYYQMMQYNLSSLQEALN